MAIEYRERCGPSEAALPAPGRSALRSAVAGAGHLRPLRALREEAGLDMAGFRSILMAVNFPLDPDDLARYRDAGIDQVVLPPMRDGVVLTTEEDLYGLVADLGEEFVTAAESL